MANSSKTPTKLAPDVRLFTPGVSNRIPFTAKYPDNAKVEPVALVKLNAGIVA